MVLYAKNPGRHISLRRVVVEAEQLPDRLVIQFARLNPLVDTTAPVCEPPSSWDTYTLCHRSSLVIPTQPMTATDISRRVAVCVSPRCTAMHR